MEFKQFHNALRILASIDQDELEATGAITKDEWEGFRGNPYKWFVRVPDDKALKVWKIMKKRFNRGDRG